MSVHYIGGVHELSRRTFTTLEDIMSAVGDIVSTHTGRVQYTWGYHNLCVEDQ